MEEVLQNLANLQFIDSRIDEITRLRGDLPEEILDIETDIKRLEARLNKLEEQEKQLKMESAQLEGDIEEANALVEKYEKQQMTVRNNREYDALTKEIESQKQRVENSNSRLEEIKILVDQGADHQSEAKKRLQETIEILERKKDELGDVQEDTRQEENALLKKREEAASNLSERYRRSYERLRNGFNNGLAVVPMERGACLGMALPPQTQVEVRHKNKIIIDENSGRIVVDQSFFDKAAELFKKSK